jgi:predicted nucleic acid-binding protein
MSEALVLDASAALAIIRREAERAIVLRTLRESASSSEVLVPGHFWLEIVNVLGLRYRHPPSRVVADIQDLDEFGVRTVELDRPLLLLAIDRVATFGLAAYDAIYLALAEAMDASLLTLDVRLMAAAGPRAVRVGPHRLSEEPPAYGADPSEVWAEYGTYLAELRRQALAG